VRRAGGKKIASRGVDMAETNITEKTLELNICEEILADIRNDYPKAFWYGPSTRSERKQGYDASLEGVEGHLLFLQFKRPLKYSARSPKKFPYCFKVESVQHDTLFSLALRHPESVYYVFPLIGDHRELIDAAPALTRETLYVPVESAGQLENPPAQHDVEAYRDHVIFHSEPVRVQARSKREIAAAITARTVSYAAFLRLHESLLQAMASLVGIGPGGEMVMEVQMPRALFVPVDVR
jgi:hypothetical protein